MRNNCSTGCQGERVCSDAVQYVQKELQQQPKKAILSCEGGCIKGEVARVAANLLAYRMERDTAVRICLGDAVTGNSGMFELLKRAPEIIAVEGCPLQCGTEIIKLRDPDLQTTVVNCSELYQFDRSKYFEILDMPREELSAHAHKVARTIQKQFFKTNCCDKKQSEATAGCQSKPTPKKEG